MSATSPTAPPRGLIAGLLASDAETSGRPTLPPNGRTVATAWLSKALVDYEALERHLELLSELYGEPVRLPRPRRESWADLPPVLSPPGGFRHSTPLPDARVVAVADRGLGVLTDDELAALMLNPIALYDLFDAIDDLAPEYWTSAMHDAGRAITPVAARPTRRVFRKAAFLAYAAVLLIGFAVGALAFRGAGASGRDDVALVVLQEDVRRGGKEKTLLAHLACGFDGFVTLVFPGAEGPPLVLPGAGGNPIRVVGGAGVSPPLPPATRRARWAIVVVTESRADDAVRAALAASIAPPMDRPAEVAAYLRRSLGPAGVGRVAVGHIEVAAGQAQGGK